MSLHQFCASSTELKVPILNPVESSRKTSGSQGCFLIKRVSILQFYTFAQLKKVVKMLFGGIQGIVN